MDGVELLCLIISKLEARPIEHYHDYEVLQKTLNFYSNIQNAQKASITSTDTTNTLKNLVRMIRTKEPITLTKSEYQKILKYIGEEKAVPVQELNVIWTPKQKAPRFTGRWWLYYYETINNVPGIVRAVMYLKLSTKSSLTVYRSIRVLIKERYTGKYYMYGTNATYMMITSRTDQTEEKDLHMLFYIGSEVPEILLGQYHNVDGNIYSGTVLISPSSGRGYTVAKFLPFKDKAIHKEVPEYIWKYFKNKRSNVLRVPAGITNEEKFKKWLDIKDQGDEDDA